MKFILIRCGYDQFLLVLKFLLCLLFWSKFRINVAVRVPSFGQVSFCAVSLNGSRKSPTLGTTGSPLRVFKTEKTGYLKLMVPAMKKQFFVRRNSWEKEGTELFFFLPPPHSSETLKFPCTLLRSPPRPHLRRIKLQREGKFICRYRYISKFYTLYGMWKPECSVFMNTRQRSRISAISCCLQVFVFVFFFSNLHFYMPHWLTQRGRLLIPFCLVAKNYLMENWVCPPASQFLMSVRSCLYGNREEKNKGFFFFENRTSFLYFLMENILLTHFSLICWHFQTGMRITDWDSSLVRKLKCGLSPLPLCHRCLGYATASSNFIVLVVFVKNHDCWKCWALKRFCSYFKNNESGAFR